MGSNINSPISAAAEGLATLRRNWAWLLAIGILLILLGIVALIDVIAATVVSMTILGWVLFVAGIFEAVQAYRHRSHSGHLVLHTLNAVLGIVIGAMLFRSPFAGAAVITLLLAAYFTVAGVVRIITSSALRAPRWGWMLTDGIITLILGILIWAHWPSASLWIVGLFIGIDLIIAGWAQIMLAVAIRRIVSIPA